MALLCPDKHGRECLKTIQDQSVEYAGVAFVKGTKKRNKFFAKNKQMVKYDEQVRT